MASDLSEEKVPLAHRVQHWLAENPKTLRNTLIAILSLTAVITLVFVLRAAAKDEHSRQLHAALEKYEQMKILPKSEARSLQMKEFGMGLKSTCEQAISTLESSAACFTAANALIEGKEFALAAKLLERAAKGYGTSPMGSVAEFMQAQALESARDFQGALALYKNLETRYATIKKSEMAAFHQARMLYYLGRYDEAEEKFAKLSRDSEGKEFAGPSRNYITLLNAERLKAK